LATGIACADALTLFIKVFRISLFLEILGGKSTFAYEFLDLLMVSDLSGWAYEIQSWW
jgi:hypothetical protein